MAFFTANAKQATITGVKILETAFLQLFLPTLYSALHNLFG